MPARVHIPHRIVSYVNVAVQALRVAGVGRGGVSAYGRVGVSAWARLTSEALTSGALVSAVGKVRGVRNEQRTLRKMQRALISDFCDDEDGRLQRETTNELKLRKL